MHQKVAQIQMAPRFRMHATKKPSESQWCGHRRSPRLEQLGKPNLSSVAAEPMKIDSFYTYTILLIYIYTYIHDMTWHGMAWHDMAWHGMAWHCIALHYIHTYIHIIHIIYIIRTIQIIHTYYTYHLYYTDYTNYTHNTYIYRWYRYIIHYTIPYHSVSMSVCLYVWYVMWCDVMWCNVM